MPSHPDAEHIKDAITQCIGVIRLDADRNITWVNEAFTRMTGYRCGELKGDTAHVFDANYHDPVQIEAMWAYLDSHKHWTGTNKYKHEDGSEIWAKLVFQTEQDEQGNICGYTAVCTDVTDLVSLAKSHKRMVSRAEYTRVVNRVYAIDRRDLSLGVLLTRALDILFEVSWLDVLSKGGVFLLDPENENTLKLSCSHGLGQNIETLCDKIKFGHCLCGRAALKRELIHASCMDDRHDIRFETMQPHGHYNVPILIGSDLIGVLVVYLEHGTKKDKDHELFLTEFAHALGVLIGFKQREEELVAKKQEALVAAELAKSSMIEAQQAEAAKSNFLSTMSHELRTPMNGVVGMLHVLKMSALQAEQLESVDLALSSADLLLSIINDILDYAKLEHGAMNMENLPVSLQDVMDDSFAIFAPMAMDKNLTLNRSITPSLPEQVSGDPTRLRQIINNFVSNAIKFTDTGGVSIAFEREENAGDPDSPDWLVIKVSDTGIGLSDEQTDVIFERFNQADNSISRKFGGTGLGLSICKQLAEAMQGTIIVDSVEGQGSTFQVKLPLRLVDENTMTNVA
jgi:PAS domain S-box-containing protein